MPDDPTDDPADKPDDLGDAGKRALDRERRARRDAEKERDALSAQVQSLKDASKSDNEKLSQQVADLTKQLDEDRVARWRAEVANEKKLTAAQARRLTGSSKEELERDADDLLETFGSKPDGPGAGGKGDDKPDAAAGGDDKKPAPGRPTPDLKGGNDPSQEPEETDPRKLADLHKRPGF